MAKELQVSTILLAILIVNLCQVYGKVSSLRNFAEEVSDCKTKKCLVRPIAEFRKLSENVWKMYKRTQAPDGAQCEKTIFSNFSNNGKTVTFNITATMQTQFGVTNLIPGKPRVFRSSPIRKKHARFFQTKEGEKTWNWCLLQYIPHVSYISQMCSKQGDRTFAVISSFYAKDKDDAEDALESISSLVDDFTLKSSTYSAECDYDPTGPLTGWGGYYSFGQKQHPYFVKK